MLFCILCVTAARSHLSCSHTSFHQHALWDREQLWVELIFNSNSYLRVLKGWKLAEDLHQHYLRSQTVFSQICKVLKIDSKISFIDVYPLGIFLFIVACIWLFKTNRASDVHNCPVDTTSASNPSREISKLYKICTFFYLSRTFINFWKHWCLYDPLGHIWVNWPSRKRTWW